MINRAKLCGEKLDEDCKFANTTTEADLCVCYGLIDNAENLLPKCKKCKALVWNAEELIVKRMNRRKKMSELKDYDIMDIEAMDDERNAEIAKLQAVIEERDKEVGKLKAGECRLKRALWLARAENAHNTIYKYHRLAYKEEVDNGIWECYINGEVYRTGKMNRKLAPHVWIELWENIECNCRAMAEKWR